VGARAGSGKSTEWLVGEVRTSFDDTLAKLGATTTNGGDAGVGVAGGRGQSSR
jgi:hypothetical protein